MSLTLAAVLLVFLLIILRLFVRSVSFDCESQTLEITDRDNNHTTVDLADCIA